MPYAVFKYGNMAMTKVDPYYKSKLFRHRRAKVKHRGFVNSNKVGNTKVAHVGLALEHCSESCKFEQQNLND